MNHLLLCEAGTGRGRVLYYSPSDRKYTRLPEANFDVEEGFAHPKKLDCTQDNRWIYRLYEYTEAFAGTQRRWLALWQDITIPPEDFVRLLQKAVEMVQVCRKQQKNDIDADYAQ
jgi:hypothetical protein